MYIDEVRTTCGKQWADNRRRLVWIMQPGRVLSSSPHLVGLLQAQHLGNALLAGRRRGAGRRARRRRRGFRLGLE
jgi:hypothetical protein